MNEGSLLEMLLQWTPVFWLLVAVIFGVVEAATVQLMSIWFAVGAVAAMVASLFGAGIWLQLVVFFVVAFLVLVFTRPLVKKVLKVGTPEEMMTSPEFYNTFHLRMGKGGEA